jgi:hypothetical protein
MSGQDFQPQEQLTRFVECGGGGICRTFTRLRSPGEHDRQNMNCQPGTSVHNIHVNCISHVTLRHRLTHLGCVYNRSL